METESLVQPRRYFTASEIAGELVGVLEVLGPPEITTGYADIYHGILKTPGGEHVDVAIKEFKAIIPRNRSTDLEALRRRTDTVGPFEHIYTPRAEINSPFLSTAHKTRNDYLESDGPQKPPPPSRLSFATSATADKPLVPSWQFDRLLTSEPRPYPA